MSFLKDVVNSLDAAGDEAGKEAKETLALLNTLATTKQHELSSNLESNIRNWKDRDEVPPGLRFHAIDATNAMAASGPADGISKVINSLLGGQDVNWKSALSSMLKSALDAILGEAKTGEAYRAEYVITMAGHAKTDTEPDTRLPVRSTTLSGHTLLRALV